MKKLFVLIFLIINFTGFAQDNAIDKYFREFQQKNSLDITTVSSKMFGAFLQNKEGIQKEELAAILKRLTGLKVLSTSAVKDGIALYNSACALMPKEFEAILTLNETDRNAKFFTLEKNGKISELVMVAFQWGRFLIVSITGDIILTDIIKLSQNLNMQGLNEVQKIKTQ